MDSKLPAKSILKQHSPAPKLSDEHKSKAARDRRNLDIALRYANKIQQRREVEKHILNSTELLIDYPQAAQSFEQAVFSFRNLIRIFQPSDFDDLITERRIDGRCGYALCDRPPRKSASAPSWRQSTEAVNFCTNECVEKAAYVKSQLSVVPAWERSAGQHPMVVVKDDAASEDVQVIMSEVQMLRVANGDDLALERGEKASSLKPKQVMTDAVVEKQVASPKLLSSVGNLNAGMSSHSAIEGYEPQRRGKPGENVTNASDDEDD